MLILSNPGGINGRGTLNQHALEENNQLKTLNPSAQKIQDLLAGLGIPSEVIEFEESTRTAQEAADRVHCQLGQIVKSLVFKTQKSNKAILVLTSGSNRVDESRLGEYAGEPILRPDADFVRTWTGFSIGGVPPLGHPQPLETYIDEDLIQYPQVWAAAGTPNAVFPCSPSDLVTITHGKVLPVKKQ
jgi:prolyl-tRNA editing enzyme YbaK/EbsC (Cys-tRNA(Pro) deacylase)